tara:strand:- start:284 stop:487 length:204 start_codon:yes stop_codon:yes gene_type:complete
MSEIKTYNVYSRKGDWMGGYSTDLEKVNPSINCLEMAKQNAIQCKGKVLAMLQDGSEKEVFPNEGDE